MVAQQRLEVAVEVGDRAEAEPALLRQRISLRGTTRNAYQMMVASGPDRAATPQGLLLFHPELRRMTLWVHMWRFIVAEAK